MFSSDLFIYLFIFTSARRLCFRRIYLFIYLLPPPGGYVFVGFIYLFVTKIAQKLTSGFG